MLTIGIGQKIGILLGQVLVNLLLLGMIAKTQKRILTLLV